MQDFNAQVAALIPSLRRYARALTWNGNSADADDLVQNCLIRALEKAHLFQPGTDLRAWLFTILHHQRVNQVRRAVRDGNSLDLDEISEVFGAESNAIPCLQLRDLRAAIPKLPMEQREVVLLVGLENLTYEQVGEILGVPVGTVRSRLSRGRGLLRKLMGIAEAEERPRQHRGGKPEALNEAVTAELVTS